MMEIVSTTPVGKGYYNWLDKDFTWHRLVVDYDRKRKYLDGKRIPWNAQEGLWGAAQPS